MQATTHSAPPSTVRTSSQARLWVIIGLLTVGIIIAYVDRTNFSVALASRDFRTLFQLSDRNRGSLNSAFFWSYAFLQIPAGWLVDRYGVKFPYALSFLFWSLISAATSLAGSVSQLFGLRFLLGVGESVATPASMRWIRFHFGEEQRGLAVGLYMSGTKLGPAIGAWIAAKLIQAYGWKAMFVWLGLGSLAWLIPWLTLVQNDDRQIERAVQSGRPQSSVSFARMLGSPMIWGTIVGTFCYMYFVYFCMTWMPAYFVERRHLSLDSMGVYQFFSFGGMATVAAIAGWAADRLIAPKPNSFQLRFLQNGLTGGLVTGGLAILIRWLIKPAVNISSELVSVAPLWVVGGGICGVLVVLGAWAFDRTVPHGLDPVAVRKAFTIAGFLLASTEVFGALSDSVSVALFFAVFSLSGLGLATANYWALTQRLIPGGAIGRIVGIQNCAANLPGIAAPILTGWLVQKTGSYNAPMQAIWFFLLLGVAAYVFLVREKYAPKGR